MRSHNLLAVAILVAACSSASPPRKTKTEPDRPALDPPVTSKPAPPAPTPAPRPPEESEAERFQRAADAFFTEHLAAAPLFAVSLGHHEYDGKLPDMSEPALKARIAMYQRARDTFTGFAPEALPLRGQVERAALLAEIGSQLFDLEVLDLPHRSPIFYVEGLSLLPYVSRDYAPREERARAIITLATNVAGFLVQAQKNLPDVMPRNWLDVALLQTSGMIEFAEKDGRAAMAGLDGPLAAELAAAMTSYSASLRGYHDFLAARLDRGSNDFALGSERFLRMLRDKEGIDITLDRLKAISEADLQRNLDAALAASRAIKPRFDVKRGMARMIKNKPTARQMVAIATKQLDILHRHVVDKSLVTIPSDDVAEVRESPPFMRVNAAFLRAPGPFEKKSLPSFYFISGPDPSWPKKQQAAYIPPYGQLFFISAHEVWPGHFLHHLHRNKNPSRVLAAFCVETNGEGWAHYTEELMWESGAAGNDPIMHLGQLQAALKRNVRFKAAIALHTEGATVDQVKAWFEDLAFLDKGTAIQQAVRGTRDPTYFAYTLGKLMIRKLHDDWKASTGDQYTIAMFNDTFLSYGCAPVPAIRRAMLGDDSPAL